MRLNGVKPLQKQGQEMGKIFFVREKSKLQIFLLLLFSVCSLVLSQPVLGATLNLTAKWTANTDPDMKEYRLYRTDITRTRIGTAPYLNTSLPFATTVPDGSAGTLLFVVTAVDVNNNESADSNLAPYSYDLSPTTYAVSGYVRTSSGTRVSGVVITGLPGNPTTDSNGYYSVTVSTGWSGTATPGKSGCTFSPPSKSYSNVSSNQTGQDYTGTLQTFTISGNAGVAGATLSYTDGTPKTATADGTGNYSFTVSYNWSGTVTPTKTGYSFSPTNRTYSNVVSNQTSQSYTGTISEVISIPKTPTGNLSGYTGTSYKFSTGGSKSSLGTSHPVEYQFEWGDGTFSSWGSSLSSYSQSHVWTVPVTYPVKAWARCKNHPTIVSAWSNSSSISIQGKPFIKVTSPNGGENFVAGTTHTITWNSAYLNPSGAIYIFYWYDGAWHPITTLSPSNASFNWTIPRTSAKASSPYPPGRISSTALWIGNWVNGKWECYDSNDQSFRILYDGWVCKISNGDEGGATLLFDEGVFAGYGISLELGMFGIDGTYSVDTIGSMSGTYRIYDFANPSYVFYSGNFTGSVDSTSTKLSLALINALDGTPVFNMAGTLIVNDPVIPGDWTGTLSGSVSGTLNPLAIDPYQIGDDIYSYVFDFSGVGFITGGGSISISGHFYFTSTTTRYSGTNAYGIYQITGAINETGIFTAFLNPSTGTLSFTMTSDTGGKYTLSGKKLAP